MDGSQIYGSDLATSNDLRSGIDGLLKTSGVGGRQLLPIAPGCEDQVNHELAVCFQAGVFNSMREIITVRYVFHLLKDYVFHKLR